jgi:hypothetical protein
VPGELAAQPPLGPSDRVGHRVNPDRVEVGQDPGFHIDACVVRPPNRKLERFPLGCRGDRDGQNRSGWEMTLYTQAGTALRLSGAS